MANMLRTLNGKVGNMQEQIGNVSREMEMLRKNKIQIIEIKKHIYLEMKNAFGGFINRHG